jgi:GxxExxY protein
MRVVPNGPGTEPSRRIEALASEVVDGGLEVHRELGPGFLEAVYEQALIVELTRRGLQVERQVPVKIEYKGFAVGEGRLDLLVGGDLIVELKTVEVTLPVHVAQVISYLRAFDRPLGLLLNFNVALFRDGIRRVIVGNRRSSPNSAKNFLPEPSRPFRLCGY